MKIVFVFLTILLSFSASAIEDSEENRLQEAERYMAATPPEELLADMAKNLSVNLPPEDRQGFKELLLEHTDIEVLENAMKASMVKIFTADELSALADFFESPLAKSSMKKMGIYMADVMPTVQAELMNAIEKMEKAKADQNLLPPDVEN